MRNAYGVLVLLAAWSLLGCGQGTSVSEEAQWKNEELTEGVRLLKLVNHTLQGEADGSTSLQPTSEEEYEYSETGRYLRREFRELLGFNVNSGRWDYRYEGADRCVEEKYTPADPETGESLLHTQVYDELGHLVSSAFYRDEELEREVTYRYDEKGRRESYTVREAGTEERYSTSYSDEGLLVYMSWHVEGELVGYLQKDYNAQGKCVEQRKYDAADELVERLLFRYDESGNLVNYAEYDGSGDEITSWLQEYNEHGHSVSFMQYERGELVTNCRYTYAYDSRGNWVKRDEVLVGADGTQEVDLRVVREIEYY